MLIESVSVKHFGLLHHFDLKLGDKLNVIEGSNESGKSTLSAFIRFMLYGFSKDEAGLDERRRRTSWDSGTAEGEMIVSVKGRRYRIERYSAIVRNLAGGEEFRDRTRTIDVAEGSLVTETDAGEYFLGVPNAVYVSSAFISQLDDTRVGEDKMLDQITSILFSGDERTSAERASEMLRRRRDRLIAAAGEQGDLSRLRARAAELVGEHDRAVEINRLLLAREAELVAGQREKKAVEEELSKLEKLKSSFKTVAVINNFDKLHNLEREEYLLEGEEAEFRLRHTQNGFFPDASYRTELTINRRVAGDSYAAYKSAQEELVTVREENESNLESERTLFRIDRHGGEEKVRSGLFAICRNAAAFLGAAVLFAVLSVLLLVLGVTTPLSMTIGAVASVVLALLGVGSLFPALARRRRARGYALDYGFGGPREFLRFLDRISEVREASRMRARALRHAEEALERSKKTYLASHASLSESVRRWGRSLPEVGVGAVIDAMVEEIDAITSEAKVYERKKREMHEEIAELRGRLGDEDETELRESLSPEIRDTLCDMSYEEILQGIRVRTEKLETIERTQVDLSDEIDGLRDAATNPVELDEKIRALTAEITEMRELQQALTLAFEAVSGAEENLRREITPRLSEYARRLMSSMTDGKYDEVGVSESLMLDFARGQERRSVEFLSGGTRDLAYIALRLAYIDLLYREAPPLVFDESFAHQDNFRATCTMKALRTLADEGVQSLIFTCRSRESTIAREVDRKYKHIKMEKLRAEAEAALALASGEREKPESVQAIPSEPSDGETLTFVIPDELLSDAAETSDHTPTEAPAVEETLPLGEQSFVAEEPDEDFLAEETLAEQAFDEEVLDEEALDEDALDEEALDEEALDGEALDEEVLDEEALDGEALDEEVLDEEVLDEEALDGEALDEEALDEEVLDEEALDGEVLDGEVLDGEALDEEALDEDALDEDTLDEEALDEEALDEDALDEEALDEQAPAAEDPLAMLLGDTPTDGEASFDLDDVLDSLYVMQGDTDASAEPSPFFEGAAALEEDDGLEEEDPFSGMLWSPAKTDLEDADDEEASFGSYAEGENV